MNQIELVAFLTSCVSLLKSGGDLGMDLSKQVQEKITAELTRFKDTFEIKYGNGGTAIVPIVSFDELYTARFVGKIQSIKEYKERTGCALIDSKLAVETAMTQNGYVFYKSPAFAD